jgi:hypothetical protein
MQLRNEFAAVEVVLDEDGNGQRLRVTDLRTGRVAWFDALELEALAWVRHDEISQFLEPARRWSDEDV